MKNTETVLARVHEAISCLPGDVSRASSVLTDLSGELQAILRAEIAASRCVASPTRKAASLLRDFRRTNTREALQYPWLDEKGRQCWTNGFLAFRFHNPLPLEARPKDAPPVTPLDLSKIFPASLTGYLSAHLPSMDDLKAFLAEHRALNGSKSTPTFDLGPGCPLVNAIYLRDLMMLFPSAQVIRFKDFTSPLVISDDSGDGLVMPIRPTAEKRAETPSAPSEAPEKPLSEFVSPDSVTGSWHFGPSSLTIDGETFPAEHSITPSGAIVIFWRQQDVSRRLRIPASHPLNARVASALQNPDEAPAKAPHAFPSAPSCLPAPAPVLLLPAPKAPEAFSPVSARPIPEKTFSGTEITGNGWRIYFNPDLQRTQVILTAANRRMTDAVIAAGFFYSPRTGSYNKKLTFRAYRAAQALADSLRRLCA